MFKNYKRVFILMEEVKKKKVKKKEFEKRLEEILESDREELLKAMDVSRKSIEERETLIDQLNKLNDMGGDLMKYFQNKQVEQLYELEGDDYDLFLLGDKNVPYMELKKEKEKKAPNSLYT